MAAPIWHPQCVPLYDFQCNACGAIYEQQAELGALAPCPECRSQDVERLLTGFAGPFTTRPRGLAAKRSDDTRRVREEQRAERTARRREQNPGSM
jgi:putative FmdB family regulatory protein